MADSNGLAKPLFDSPEAKVDIVFVHGLGGDRIKTWTSDPTKNTPQPTFWPKYLLKEKCKDNRILSFGYNSSFVHFYPFYGPDNVPIGTTIDDHSTALFKSLVDLRNRTNTSARPIIFVAHSLGGLVVANALSRQHGSDTGSANLVDKTRGAIFLGTPFAGSEKAQWADIGLKIVSHVVQTNRENTTDLQKRSMKLISIVDAFTKLIKLRDRAKPWLEVSCYFEAAPMKVLGKSVGVIVDKASATLPGIAPLSIEDNHVDMCKFEDEFRNGYISISDTLAEWTKTPVEEVKTELTGGVSMGDIHYNAPISGASGIITGHIYSTKEKAVQLTGTHNQNTYHGDRFIDQELKRDLPQ